MEVGKDISKPDQVEQLAEQTRTLNIETKEEFMVKLRALAERIDVEEMFAVSYSPEMDREHPSSRLLGGSAFNNNVASNTWGPTEINAEKFSDAFGSAYDAHHVSPIIVSDIGDAYHLNANYATELAAKRQNKDFYNEDGTLKTVKVEKGSTVEAPTYNRSLAPTKNTIEDTIAIHIRDYVEKHGGSPEEFFKEVESIRNEKYKAFYEKKVGSKMDEIKGRVYEGGVKMPECIIQ